MRTRIFTLALVSLTCLAANAQMSPRTKAQASKIEVKTPQMRPAITPQLLDKSATSVVLTPAQLAKSRAGVKAKAEGEGEETPTLDAYYYPITGALYSGMFDSTTAYEDWGVEPGDYTSLIASYVFVNPRKDITIYNGSSYDEEQPVTFKWTDGNDEEMEQDEKGNGLGSIWGYNYMPQLEVVQGEESSTYTMSTEYNEETHRAVWASSMDEIHPLTNAVTYAEGPYIGFNSTSTCTNEPFGATEKICKGFAQYFDAPLTHVYAESLYIMFYNEAAKEAPLEGQPITATIYTFGENGEFIPYASATASDENISASTSWGAFMLKFEFVDEDPVLGVVNSPIVLPYEDFMVVFTGFENITNAIQPMMQYIASMGIIGHGYGLLEDDSFGTVPYTNTNYPTIDWLVGFNGLVVDAELADYGDGWAVWFPEEGGDGLTGYSIDEETKEEVYYNDIDFYSSCGADDWVVVECPDWIIAVVPDEEYLERGWMLFTMEADPLPAGETGRSGQVVFDVYGKEIVVPVTQGEVNGIADVKAKATKTNGNVYSLSGRLAGKSAKGIRIANGKKFFAK